MENHDPSCVPHHADSLFRDWQRVVLDDGLPRLLHATVEPGPIALRARWHYLRRLSVTSTLPGRHAIEIDQWRNEIDLETAGDLAVRRHEPALGREKYLALLDVASHPVATVQALIGVADADRHDEDLAAAERGYRQAKKLADSVGFEFGAVRALLPLAHLTRRSGSAEQMLALADECEQKARDLGDGICTANAMVARGEALEILSQRGAAVDALTSAYDLFAAVGSREGMAAAGIRLMDVHRRRRDSDAILEFAPTFSTMMGQDGPFQESVDFHDLMAEVHEERRDFSEAMRACREGLSIAGARYPRGTANLQRTLGSVLRKSGWADKAMVEFRQALAFYQGFPDERWSVSLCLRQLALCAEELDDTRGALDFHLTALEEIEGMRAQQVKPRWQQEYRTRFDIVYRDALLTAVRLSDVPAFIAVFESLWGRRLPGVTDGVNFDPIADPALAAQMLVREDQERRLLKRRIDLTGPPEDDVGADGRSVTAERYAEVTDPALAAAYRPMQRSQGAALEETLDDATAYFLVSEVPGVPRRLAWLSKLPHEPTTLGERLLSEEESDFLDVWGVLWPMDALPADVEPLAGILPDSIKAIERGTQLQLIGLENMWALPWAAVRGKHGFLGAQLDMRMAPSLTLARAGTTVLKPGLPTGSTVVGCIGEQVRHHDLRSLGKLRHDPRSAEAALEVARVLSVGGADAVVVVAHARPSDDVGHYLEIGSGNALTPIDVLFGPPLESLALLSCWGARVPGVSVGEPLTLATVALARGASQILTSVSELGDSPVAAAIVNDTLWFARDRPWSTALMTTLSRRAADLNGEPIIDWACLTVIGGW